MQCCSWRKGNFFMEEEFLFYFGGGGGEGSSSPSLAALSRCRWAAAASHHLLLSLCWQWWFSECRSNLLTPPPHVEPQTGSISQAAPVVGADCTGHHLVIQPTRSHHQIYMLSSNALTEGNYSGPPPIQITAAHRCQEQLGANLPGMLAQLCKDATWTKLTAHRFVQTHSMTHPHVLSPRRF